MRRGAASGASNAAVNTPTASSSGVTPTAPSVSFVAKEKTGVTFHDQDEKMQARQRGGQRGSQRDSPRTRPRNSQGDSQKSNKGASVGSLRKGTRGADGKPSFRAFCDHPVVVTIWSLLFLGNVTALIVSLAYLPWAEKLKDQEWPFFCVVDFF